MLRATASAARAAATVAMCGAGLNVSAAARLTRNYGAATPLTTALSTGLCSSSGCFPRALVLSRRTYAQKRNPHDSNTEDLSNTFFDVQDVDADRLTHFYWDSNDEADTPYDASLWDSLLGEGEMDEFSGESLMFVDERDQQLLDEEYLR